MTIMRCKRRLRPGWLVPVVGWLMIASVFAEGPAPTPPAWERDLETARILQTALALAPAADPSVDTDRRQRLGNLYDQLLSCYPEQAKIQQAAGAYYEQDGQTDRAISCWQHAETLDPHDAATANTLGSLFLKNARVSEACEQFERAVAVQPNMAAYHFDLANVLYLFRKQLLRPPSRPDEHSALIEALEHFRRASELSPGDLRLAQAYAETFYIFPDPDWQQAVAAWKTVLGLSGGDTDFANGQLARVSQLSGNRADMESYLGRIHSPAFDPMKAKLRQKADAAGR